MPKLPVEPSISLDFLQKIKETYQPFLTDTTKKLVIVNIGAANQAGYFLTLDQTHIEYKQKNSSGLMTMTVDLLTGELTCTLPCEDPFQKVFHILSQAVQDIAAHKATIYSSK